MGYRELSTETLMSMRKADIIEHLRVAERNFRAMEQTVEQQYQNTKDWIPVVHGEWVIEERISKSNNPYMEDNYYISASCSICKYTLSRSCRTKQFAKLHTTNYCSYCGAKMDG